MVKKKFLALAMTAVTVMSLFAGCGNNSDDKKDGKDDGKFYLYSWNDEASARIKKLYEAKYGKEEADKIEPVITGKSETYQQTIDPLLKDPNNEKYPDMIALEADYIKKYTDAEITLPVTDLDDVKEEDCKDMYDYTVTIGKDKDGKLKAFSWQSCPGCMIYRRDLAEKYLGTGEPEKVQEMFKDWNAVKETGKKIKEASSGECQLFQGYSELQRPYQNARQAAWVKDGKLNIDPVMIDYMKASKYFVDEGLCTANADDQQFKTNWTANMGTDNVFAYTSCTWFNQYTLKDNVKGKPGEEDGKWGMIQGPVEFSWGGTWLAATKNCSNKEIAGKIMKLLQDKESMSTIYTEFGDFPNNKAAVEELAGTDKENEELSKRFGGQKALEFFKDKAANIKVPEMCGEDLYANEQFNNLVSEFIAGKKDEAAVKEEFTKKMKDQFNNIKE